MARAPLDAIKLEQQTRPANATAPSIEAGQAALVGLSTYPLALAAELPYVRYAGLDPSGTSAWQPVLPLIEGLKPAAPCAHAARAAAACVL